jgi:hypothetical protein
MSNMTNPNKSNNPGAKLRAAMALIRERDEAQAEAEAVRRHGSMAHDRGRSLSLTPLDYDPTGQAS